MSSGNAKRKRLVRVAPLPPGRFSQFFANLRRGDVLLRLALAAVAAVMMWAVTGAWNPHFPWRLRHTPARDLTARVPFEVLDPQATERARDRARAESPNHYVNDPRPLSQLLEALNDRLYPFVGEQSYDELKAVWNEFSPPAEKPDDLSEEQQKIAFERFRQILKQDPNLTGVKNALKEAFTEAMDHGLLVELQHALGEGSQTEIVVYPEGRESEQKRVAVSRVRIGEAAPRIQMRIGEELAAVWPSRDDAQEVSKRLFEWLRPRLPEKAVTLSYKQDASKQAAERAAAQTPPVMFRYAKGDKLLKIEGGIQLQREHIDLLRQEHAAFVEELSPWERAMRSAAEFGMYLALYLLCGSYIFYKHPRLLSDLRRYLTLLASLVVTVGLSHLLADERWRNEMAPLILFGITASIVYKHELALLLSASLALVISLSLGQGLAEFVVLTATVSAAVLLTGEIRSRTRLVYVGLAASVISFLTAYGVGILSGQPNETLIFEATWFALCALVSGLLMTALLPFVERVFDVQTDLTLLEIGDVQHPLLQELVRRAPGTYNHSINVASIGEAAAEAIGANGLLVRVGAYFHDVGKMLKPGYFVENQGQSGNRHDALAPAMSTLVIIAHVKDGADLARRHGLPQSLIDFIEQHHGTTLVEYFYKQAAKQCEGNPDAAEVDETSFRYPGPKPQTKEAAVMMLADAVESASRTLVDPAPSRIESLVEEIGQKRLLDGQFDECGLTLQELRLIEDSLIKSLIAVYHGRVKYPSQQTA